MTTADARRRGEAWRTLGRGALAASSVAALSACWVLSCRAGQIDLSCNGCCPPGREAYYRSADGDESAGHCRCRFAAAGTSGSPSELIEGFGVAPFSLTRDPMQNGRPVFMWAPPAGAVDVRCALFQCPPIIRSAKADNAVGETLRTIVNFESCVLAYKDFHGADGLFDVTDSEPYKFDAHPCAVPTRLLVGCWSFDEMDVNGATALVPVAAADVALSPAPQVRDRFAADCAVGSTAGQTCDLRDLSDTMPGHDIGTCLDGECRPRCETAADCPPEDTADAGPAWTCEDAGMVKVCKKGA